MYVDYIRILVQDQIIMTINGIIMRSSIVNGTQYCRLLNQMFVLIQKPTVAISLLEIDVVPSLTYQAVPPIIASGMMITLSVYGSNIANQLLDKCVKISLIWRQHLMLKIITPQTAVTSFVSFTHHALISCFNMMNLIFSRNACCLEKDVFLLVQLGAITIILS